MDRGENHGLGKLHVFTPPFCEVMVNPTWAGDLAWEIIPYSCATAPDY